MTHTSHAAQRQQIQSMVLVAMFTAIIFLLAFTPIGMIDLPIIKATILHVPVIIASLLLGPKKGAFLGGVFGFSSLLKNTLIPNLSSFVFTPFIPLPGSNNGSLLALVVCFIPRILTGVLPWFVYRFIRILLKKDSQSPQPIAAGIAAIVGAFTNTFLVMGLIGVLFSSSYSAAQGIPTEALFGFISSIILANGIPEAIAAAVLVPVVYLPLATILKHQSSTRGVLQLG